MTNKNNDIILKKNLIANCGVSLLVALLPTIFMFFIIREGLVRSFASDVVNEMAALDIIEKKSKGEYYNEDTHIFDYIKRLPSAERDQNAIRYRYNKISYMFTFLPVVIILILLFVRGWSNVKLKVKEVDKSIFENQGSKNGFKHIKWYISKLSFSYGFIIKRMVLGADYLLGSEKMKQFIINHELRHLKFRDSILKNYLINIRNLFLPIFYILFWFFSFFIGMFQILFPWIESQSIETPDLNNMQIVALVSFAIIPLLVILMIRYAFKQVINWFAYTKEFLADQYAMLKTNGYIPELNQNIGKYHPSGESRMDYMKSSKRIVSAFPIFLLTVLLLNINFGNVMISDEFYFLSIFGVFFIFVFLDIFYIKLHSISIKEWSILFILILLFGLLNYISIHFHEKNQTINYNLTNNIFNVIINIAIAFILIVFGIAHWMLQHLKKTKPLNEDS